MKDRTHDHLKLMKLEIDPDARIEALKLIGQLEDIQGDIDDVVEQNNRQNELLSTQTESIEAVIQSLIRGGVIHS